MATADASSRAKYVRDFLDRALELPAPDITPEEFDRQFGLLVTSDEIKKLCMADVMIRQLVMKAAKGNDKSISEVLDRLLGKPVQATETISKSYNYHDYLIECRNADAAEACRTIDMVTAPGVPRSVENSKKLRAALMDLSALDDILTNPPLEDEVLGDFL